MAIRVKELSHDIVTCWRPHLQTSPHLGLGFLQTNLGGTNLQSIVTSEPYTTESLHPLFNLSVYSISVLDALHIYRVREQGTPVSLLPMDTPFIENFLVKKNEQGLASACSVEQTLTC